MPCKSQNELEIRKAKMGDVASLKALMTLSISKLQAGFLSADQITASHLSMGLDTQLIEDRTYFCVMNDGAIVGCGGWSFRATLYGGNHSSGRNVTQLNPKTDRARIRAMYTHPDHTRRGIGHMILRASEDEARLAGFRALEMAATLAGEPFYKASGYHVESRWDDRAGCVPVPLLTMVKSLMSQ